MIIIMILGLPLAKLIMLKYINFPLFPKGGKLKKITLYRKVKLSPPRGPQSIKIIIKQTNIRIIVRNTLAHNLWDTYLLLVCFCMAVRTERVWQRDNVTTCSHGVVNAAIAKGKLTAFLLAS